MSEELTGEPVEPKWDTSDPSSSFRRYAAFLHDKAKWTFLKDKTHVELVFVFLPTGEGNILLVQGDRDEFAANLKTVVQNNDIIGIVHIAEAWTRFGGRGDHVTKQLMLGEMGVSDLRPEDRGEALFVSMQSRDGHSKCWVEPIVRNAKEGEVSLGEGFEIAGIGGRFGKVFE